MISLAEHLQKQGVQLLSESPTRMKAVCPLHPDKNPSFKVYLDTDSFFCFGCSRGGSIYDYVMIKEGVDFYTASQILQAGYQITDEQLIEQINEMKYREVDNNIPLMLQLCGQIRNLFRAEKDQVGLKVLKALEKKGYTRRTMEKIGNYLEKTNFN